MAGLSTAVGSAMTGWAEPRRPAKTAAAAAKPSTLAPKVEAPPMKVDAPARADSAAAPKPPEISEDARALAAIVERRYGSHLQPKQLEAVTLEIENRLQGGKRLRDVKLANADEPDFTFRA